jgi:exonuclease III
MEEGHFIIIKGNIHLNEISILNIFAPNTRKTIFVKETLLKLKSHTKLYTLIVGDFNIPLSPIDRQKWNREIVKINAIRNQMDLTDIYRTFYPHRKEYTFFSVPHGSFSKIEHIVSHKASLNRYKKTEITPVSSQNTMD